MYCCRLESTIGSSLYIVSSIFAWNFQRKIVQEHCVREVSRFSNALKEWCVSVETFSLSLSCNLFVNLLRCVCRGIFLRLDTQMSFILFFRASLNIQSPRRFHRLFISSCRYFFWKWLQLVVVSVVHRFWLRYLFVISSSLALVQLINDGFSGIVFRVEKSQTSNEIAYHRGEADARPARKFTIVFLAKVLRIHNKGAGLTDKHDSCHDKSNHVSNRFDLRRTAKGNRI